MSKPRTCDPVGTVEIVARLGVSRAAVDQWRARYVPGSKWCAGGVPPFPEPRWTVGGRPAWNWDEIEAWAKATDRLPETGTSTKARTTKAAAKR